MNGNGYGYGNGNGNGNGMEWNGTELNGMLSGGSDRVTTRSTVEHSARTRHMHDCDTQCTHMHMCRAHSRAVLFSSSALSGRSHHVGPLCVCRSFPSGLEASWWQHLAALWCAVPRFLCGTSPLLARCWALTTARFSTDLLSRPNCGTTSRASPILMTARWQSTKTTASFSLFSIATVGWWPRSARYHRCVFRGISFLSCVPSGPYFVALLDMLQMIDIHFPPRVYLCLRCLCLMHEEFYSWLGKLSRQRVRELHRRHFALCMSLARDRSVPGRPWLQWRAKPKHYAMHHVFDQTGNPAQFLNCGDESGFGWACNVAQTVHVSVLPRAFMQKFLVWLDKHSGLVGGE